MKSSVNLNEVMLAVPAMALVERLSGVRTLEDLYETDLENLTFIEEYQDVECPPLFNPGKGSKLVVRTIDYRVGGGEETIYEVGVRRCHQKEVDLTPIFMKFSVDWDIILRYVNAHLRNDFFPHQVEVDIDVVIGDNGTEHLDICLTVD